MNDLNEAAARRRQPYPRASQCDSAKEYVSVYVHRDEWGDVNKLADAMLDRLAADETNPPPAWHDKPTGPGWWAFPPTARSDSWVVELRGIEHTLPTWQRRCFGPIPPGPTVKQS